MERGHFFIFVKYSVGQNVWKIKSEWIYNKYTKVCILISNGALWTGYQKLKCIEAFRIHECSNTA